MTIGISLSGTSICESRIGATSLIFVGPEAEGVGTAYVIENGFGNEVNGVSIMEVQP